MSALLLAGAAALAVGALAAAAVRGALRPALRVQALGAGLLGLGGAWSLAQGTSTGDAFTDGFEPALGVDPLSGAFLLALGLVAVPALLYAGGYLRPGAAGRANGALAGVFALALAGVLVARDPLTFLLCWEAMTLAPAAMILVARSDEAARRTTFVYVSITHLGGAGVWVAILLLADAGALSGASPVATGSALQTAIVLTALVGFGTKAGLMPVHAWLPRAHPIAPAPASALMSGVMTKVALYGLIRVLLEWVGETPRWVGALVVLVGAASALAGILYALFQHDLKRLLAFSTIDNVGIVVLGIGAAVAFRTAGDATWAAFALAAALLHVLTHACAKGALFLAAGSLERAVGGLDLDGLGGLLRRLPWTGSALLVACASIAGLPPLGGFASEWATLQALVHLPATGDVVTGTVGAIGLGALGAAAAVTAFAFVKVAGMALFGPPPRSACANATEPGPAMRLAPALLAAGCVLLGLVPGVLFAWLTRISPGAPAVEVVPTLDLPTTGDLPTPGIAVWLALLTGVLALLRGRRVAEPAPTWACGQPLDAGLWWTGAGFTKSLRLVLEAVLRPEREVTIATRGGVVQTVSYRGRVPHLLDERVYRPITAWALTGAGVARRLQSGRLGSYVVYLILLVLALLLGVRVGVIGVLPPPGVGA